MGRNHIRVFDGLSDAKLVAVVEPDENRARKISSEYNLPVYEDVDKLEGVEAATVAVPNDFHRSVSERLLAQGLDLLVEKPLATTAEDARAIVEVADAEGAVLQVGHIERFNPAVETLLDILADEEVIAIEAHRLGPFNEQLSAESVIFDLMIHDLDIVELLIDSEIKHMNAIGRQAHSDEIDHAVANIKYANGVLGTMTASHVTHGKIRTLDVTTKDAYVQLDYQNQSLDIQRRGIDRLTSFDQSSGYRTETLTETPFVQTREPLKNELRHFVECVRTQKTSRVDGSVGVKAIEHAETVVSLVKNEQ